MASNDANYAIHFCNGVPNDASKEEKMKFNEYCIQTYVEENYRNEDLSECFAEAFNISTVEYFKDIDVLTRRRLRDLFAPQRCRIRGKR